MSNIRREIERLTAAVSAQLPEADGKSPLELMFLGAVQGTELIVEVAGPDAPAALGALREELSTVSKKRPLDSSLPQGDEQDQSGCCCFPNRGQGVTS
jgi:phosphotransferase system HPr-like phosphotransfer protein